MSNHVPLPRQLKRGDTIVVHGVPCIVWHVGIVDGEERVLIMRNNGKLVALSATGLS